MLRYRIRAAHRACFVATTFSFLLLAACGESVVTPPGPPTLSISLSPTSATTMQGTSLAVTGSATVGGGFSGDVTFTVTGLPAGVTATVESVDPPGVGGSTFTASIRVDVGEAVAPGTYMGTVTAAGDGVSAETTWSLTVVASPAESFGLGSVSAVSVQQGAAAARTVDITRSGGFTGDVTITVEGLPADVTATPAPAVVSGASSEITITVGAGAAVGTTTLTVRGTATGLPDATTTFDLTVTAPPTSTDITVDFSACLAMEEKPVWVAFQDGAGTGSWDRVTGTSDVYDLSVTQSTFGVTLAFDSPSQTDLSVTYYGTTHVQDGRIDGCTPPNTKSVNGTAAGLVGFTNASLGGASSLLFVDGPFQINAVPDGAQDFVGFSLNNSGGADRMLITRDLDIASGGSLGTIDFGAGFFPQVATITIDGLVGGESGFAGMEYASSSAGSMCQLSPLHSDLLPPSGPFTFVGRSAPPAEQMSDEFHVASLSASLGNQFKEVREAVADHSSRTVALPADLPVPDLTDVSAGAYLRLHAEYMLPAEYDDLTIFGYTHDSRNVGILAVGDAMSTDVSLELPDFSSVDGWDDSWAIPATATGVDYSITGTGLTSQAGLCVDGGRRVHAILTGSYN